MVRFCIILGAMKAGTTSLFNYLAQHPEIAPCNEKEPSFFTHHYNDNVEQYLDLWKGQSLKNKVLIEASTNYTKHPSFPKASPNILDFTRKNDVDMKFIYIMRNPIERIESHYTYSYARWTNESLDERIKQGHLIDVSQYAHQLDLYYEKFNPDRFLLLKFDELKEKPEKLLTQICQFLNIDAHFEFTGFHEIHNKSQGRVITKKVDRLYQKHPSVKSFAKIFPKSFKRFLSRLIFRKKIQSNFKLTNEQRVHVYGDLKDDMARLHGTYGVDVSKWGF